MPPELLDALRACMALGMLGQRGDLLHITVDHPPPEAQLAARRAVLAALLRAYGPMRLWLVDPGDSAAALDALGLERDGEARILHAGVDLAALERAALHVGAWLLVRSRHADARPLVGENDVFRSPVLGVLCARGEIDAALASYWDDREWLLAARPLI